MNFEIEKIKLLSFIIAITTWESIIKDRHMKIYCIVIRNLRSGYGVTQSNMGNNWDFNFKKVYILFFTLSISISFKETDKQLKKYKEPMFRIICKNIRILLYNLNALKCIMFVHIIHYLSFSLFLNHVMVEKVLFLGEIFEKETLDLQVMRSPEFENHLSRVWSVSVSICLFLT